MLDIAIWNPRVGLTKAGGTETFLRHLSKGLDQIDSVDLTVYTHAKGKLPKALDSVKTIHVPTIPKEHTLNQIATKTPILDAEIESLSGYLSARISRILNGHDVVSTHYYLDAVLLSRWLSTPVVFRLPGIKQTSPRWDLAFRSPITTYIANSHTTQDRVREWYDKELAGPVYAGVDCERFSVDTDTIENRILYVGRLGQGKGLKQLMQAASLLPNEYTIRIVGDGPLKQELQAIAPNTVDFAGTVPHSQIHHEYQQAKCSVLASVHEGFAVTVIESLATGTPVVATDLDSTRLTIDHGETGILLENREPATIANGLETVMQNDSYQQKAQTLGRKTAKQYDWSEQAEKYLEVIKCSLNQ